MALVIFDTEYVADKGLLEPGFMGWQNREVVQIAALKFAPDLTVIDSINLYAKPYKNLRISEYFNCLTGITNELLASRGEDFPLVYQKFKTFVGDCPCYSHGWSLNSAEEGDGKVINETLSYHQIVDDTPPDYRNIAHWFREQYAKRQINITKQSSGEIASLLGVEDELKKLNLQPHNALYDVYSILSGMKFLGFRLENK